MSNLEKIFRLRDQGFSFSQIPSILGNEEKHRQETRCRGINSVENVKKVLNKLKNQFNISHIKETKPFSYKDNYKKEDIIFKATTFNKDNQPRPFTVSIQVKSSDAYVDKFLSEIQKKFHLEPYRFLADHNQILLNGQDSEEKIKENFSWQFQIISKSIQSEGKPPC